MEKYTEMVQKDRLLVVFREEDSAWIPCDRNNRDYQEYLKWLKEREVNGYTDIKG